MGEVIPFEDPLNYRRVMQRIRSLLEEGTIFITPHAREEMAKDDLDDTDVIHILGVGSIRPGSHSKPRAHWRYVVEGQSVDRRKAACVVEVEGGMVVVTVFALRGRRR
jgi:pentose-5-phosphate-3-epimerase